MAEVIEHTSNTSTSGSNVFSNINTLLGTLGGVAVGLWGNEQDQQTNTQTPIVVQENKKNNTGLIIGLSVGFVVLVAVVFFAFKKKK